MKNLMNLKGAKLLSKVEQKSINGGGNPQNLCEMAGGTWVCVGLDDCGCVYDGPVDPPIK